MPDHSLRRRQIVTVLLLFAGYASLYFCRADLSVAMPLLIEELPMRVLARGLAAAREDQYRKQRCTHGADADYITSARADPTPPDVVDVHTSGANAPT